jgi:hypothetical protein
MITAVIAANPNRGLQAQAGVYPRTRAPACSGMLALTPISTSRDFMSTA